MVAKKKKGVWEDATNKINEDVDDGIEPMRVGLKGIFGNQTGGMNKGTASLRAWDGKNGWEFEGEKRSASGSPS